MAKANANKKAGEGLVLRQKEYLKEFKKRHKNDPKRCQNEANRLSHYTSEARV